MVASVALQNEEEGNGFDPVCSTVPYISPVERPRIIPTRIARLRRTEILKGTRAVFFFQPPIVLLRKYEIRGRHICASRDCAAPPPQPLPLSAPMR